MNKIKPKFSGKKRLPNFKPPVTMVQTEIKPHLNAKPAPSLLVNNWQSGWKWFSSWAFALIIFFATVPVPDEILAILPEDKKNLLLAFLAFAGLLLRFINQSAVLSKQQEKDYGQHR